MNGQNQVLQELFEAGVDHWGAEIALVFAETRWTYRKINGIANQLARYLKELGVGPEVCVGVSLERSAEMIVVILAVLKAGGAYVPLDPEFPSERLEFIVKDAGVGILITQASLRKYWPQYSGCLVDLEQALTSIKEFSEANLPHESNTTHLAYILYTSGSTGVPKAVMGHHGGMINRLKWSILKYPLGKQDICCQKKSLNFIGSVTEIFDPLIAGVPLVIMSKEEAKDANAMLLSLTRNRITRLWAFPSLLKALLECSISRGEALADLNMCFSSGEELSLELAVGLARAFPRMRLLNIYGSSEVASDVIVNEVESDKKVIAIGRAIINTTAYILDGSFGVLPRGVRGELYIGGLNLARGYLGQASFTAERFLPDPFSNVPGMRMYRTGDAARFDSSGKIELMGRVDRQVKLRGYRIELGEVETVLDGHPDVGQCVVVVKGDDGGGKRLVAYVVGEAGKVPMIKELRSYLKGKLPEYMVPGVIVELKQMPLTPNGKVDRKALPEPERAGLGGGYEASSSPQEELLVDIWAEVLKIDQVGVKDNFFELGGHSLMATQLVTRVREAFGVEMPLRKLFNEPTVRGMGQEVERMQREGKGVKCPALYRVNRKESDNKFPLSYAQERLWFLDQLEPGNAAYNMPEAIRIKGDLEVVVLERTISEIVRRHETLRTTFEMKAGGAVQVIHPAREIKLEMVDLGGLDEAEQERRIRKIRVEEAGRSFDLGSGPLVRVKLVKVGAGEHVLHFTLHHIVSDGWSMGVLMKEFGLLYEAYVKGESSPLKELEVQYVDYAIWQRKWLQGEVLAVQLEYWRKQLKELPVLELPTDRVRPVVQSHRGDRERVALDKELTAGLVALSRREGVTLFMTLSAAFKVLLSRYSGQEDIVVGTPIANRGSRETEGMIGFFVNTLALRTNLGGDPTFLELLKREREVALGAYAHQDVPFEQLVQELQVERDLSRNPLFQVMLALQNAPQEALRLENLEFAGVETEGHTAKFDLALDLMQVESGLRGAVEYCADLFERGTIEKLIENWERILREVVKNPSQRLEEVEVLSEREREHWVKQRNTLRLEYERRKSLKAKISEEAGQKVVSEALMAVETAVSRIWEQILNQEELPRDLNFFELGGNSIKLILMLFEVNNQFNQFLTLIQIFDHLTIREFSLFLHSFIKENEGENTQCITWDPLTSIKVEGSKQPLFLVHDWTGSVDFLLTLAPHLDVDRPLYGLRAPNLEDKSNVKGIYESLEEMAAHYIEAISTIQPKGPYFVGGYSYGGHIAFEMARQLVKKELEVRWLGIFDTTPIAPGKRFEADDFQLAVAYIGLRDRRPLTGDEINFETLRQLNGEAKMENLLGQLREVGRVPLAINLCAFKQTIMKTRERMNSFIKYIPQEYSGVITLFLTDGTKKLGRTVAGNGDGYGWGPLAKGGIRVYHVAGEHHNMMSEMFVQDLAGKLNTSLLDV